MTVAYYSPQGFWWPRLSPTLSKTIFWVEDESRPIMSSIERLEFEGFSIAIIEDYIDAQAMYYEMCSSALIIMDLVIPKIRVPLDWLLYFRTDSCREEICWGRKLLWQLSNERNQTVPPVLVYSLHPQLIDSMAFIGLTMSVLPKPVSASKLAAEVHRLLERYRRDNLEI